MNDQDPTPDLIPNQPPPKWDPGDWRPPAGYTPPAILQSAILSDQETARRASKGAWACDE